MPNERVGMIVPSLNTIAEDDCRRFLPADVGYHVHRVRLRKTGGKVTWESLAESAGEAVVQSTMLADADVDAIAFNCTGASITGGPAGAAKLADDIATITRTPATTTAVSLVQALHAVRAIKIVHVCPFTPEFSDDESAFFRAAGFDVVTSRGLGFTDAKVAARMSPEEICETVAPFDSSEADAIFLACANVRAMEAIAPLEARLGKPVVSSNQAVIWALMRLIGRADAVPNGGLLFEKAMVKHSKLQFRA